MGDCSVAGCARGVVARGLCDAHRKRLARHGHLEQTRPPDWGRRTSHPLYKLWDSMRRRCRDPHHKDYPNYGARGVTVDPRWQDFWAFLRDIGPRPTPQHTVDRKDTNGHYSPENCHWATPVEQGRNKRSAVITEALAREIKRRQALGERTGDIARSMRIHYDHVRNVIVGKSWGDLAP